MPLLKLGILFLAFLSVFFGSLILGVSRIIHDAGCRQQIIHQQKADSHKLHDWRLR